MYYVPFKMKKSANTEAPLAKDILVGLKKTIPWLSMAVFFTLLLFVGIVYRSFVVGIFIAAILFILFRTPYDFLVDKLNGRRSFAAVLIIMLVIALLVIPAAFVSVNLAHEALIAIDKIKKWLTVENINTFYQQNLWIEKWLGVSVDDLGRIGEKLTPSVQNLGLSILSQGRMIMGHTMRLIFNFVISLIFLFFLLRNSSEIIAIIYNNLPLPGELKSRLGKRMLAVFDAVVKGNLLVAVGQGVSIGALFLIFGLPTPFLYGVIGIFFGLIPVVGTNIIWIPAAIMLYLDGSTVTAILFGVLSFLLYQLLENVAKPLLMDKELNLHPIILLMALLGGLSEFGIKGLILGPFIVTTFLSVWHMIKLWNETHGSKI